MEDPVSEVHNNLGVCLEPTATFAGKFPRGEEQDPPVTVRKGGLRSLLLRRIRRRVQGFVGNSFWEGTMEKNGAQKCHAYPKKWQLGRHVCFPRVSHAIHQKYCFFCAQSGMLYPTWSSEV